MIEIGLDLGKLQSALSALTDRRSLRRGVLAAAKEYTKATLDWIAAGRSFTPRNGGGLEQSIGWMPRPGPEAEVYANKEYAGFVEEGTRPHVIRPKPGRKALKIEGAQFPGGYVLRRKVNHPGTDPLPFMFADRARREGRVLEAFRSVLEDALDG